MLCLIRYLFVVSTSVIDCLGRFVPEMTYCVSSGTLNLAKLKLKLFTAYTACRWFYIHFCHIFFLFVCHILE